MTVETISEYENNVTGCRKCGNIFVIPEALGGWIAYGFKLNNSSFLGITLLSQISHALEGTKGVAGITVVCSLYFIH